MLVVEVVVPDDESEDRGGSRGYPITDKRLVLLLLSLPILTPLLDAGRRRAGWDAGGDGENRVREVDEVDEIGETGEVGEIGEGGETGEAAIHGKSGINSYFAGTTKFGVFMSATGAIFKMSTGSTSISSSSSSAEDVLDSSREDILRLRSKTRMPFVFHPAGPERGRGFLRRVTVWGDGELVMVKQTRQREG